MKRSVGKAGTDSMDPDMSRPTFFSNVLVNRFSRDVLYRDDSVEVIGAN